MDKDKEILLNEDTAKKFADMLAKWFMPDIKILEQLGPLKGNVRFDGDNYTYSIPYNRESPENQ